MKIIIEEIPEAEEEQVVIRCHELDDSLLALVRKVKNRNDLIVGYEEDKIRRIRPDSIYYFEAVDNKIFLYCRKSVYESRQKLYELEERLGEGSFFRASKSVLLNLERIDFVRPAFTGRFEAVLDNGEKVMISRQYVPELKKRLGL
ncbi:LytTR family DNA-binding domain-containing protein [Anaerolentibacter hominis]|uniref:LytTR family DNA-binding domain-containing protein n=1 Tax=Anaerolentibacter hominis TaxID=3079009 RepID=UPI0031B86163